MSNDPFVLLYLFILLLKSAVLVGAHTRYSSEDIRLNVDAIVVNFDRSQAFTSLCGFCPVSMTSEQSFYTNHAFRQNCITLMMRKRETKPLDSMQARRSVSSKVFVRAGAIRLVHGMTNRARYSPRRPHEYIDLQDHGSPLYHRYAMGAFGKPIRGT